MADLRERVLGSPEISTDGFTPYQPAVRRQLARQLKSTDIIDVLSDILRGSPSQPLLVSSLFLLIGAR
jgi:hypothetical protein